MYDNKVKSDNIYEEWIALIEFLIAKEYILITGESKTKIVEGINKIFQELKDKPFLTGSIVWEGPNSHQEILANVLYKGKIR
jgi:hypothetical protein